MNKGGAALKQAIHIARAKAGITSDVALSAKARVHYDTLMHWYGDKTVPRGAELKRVAEALGVGYADLLAAYEGTDAEPPELSAAIREQTAAIKELVAAIRATLPPPPEPIVARGREAVEAAERELAREKARDSSTHRRSGRPRRSSDRGRGSLAGDAS